MTARKPHGRHAAEFKEQALLKAKQRGTQTVKAVAEELNMSPGTLQRWLNEARATASAQPAQEVPLEGSSHTWSPAQRLQALQESFALSGPALHAWCRQRGLFEHQLTQWRHAFCTPAAGESRETKLALRELQTKHEQLQRELRRKERALAEAAALLVLQKKFQALLGDEDK